MFSCVSSVSHWVHFSCHPFVNEKLERSTLDESVQVCTQEHPHEEDQRKWGSMSEAHVMPCDALVTTPPNTFMLRLVKTDFRSMWQTVFHSMVSPTFHWSCWDKGQYFCQYNQPNCVISTWKWTNVPTGIRQQKNSPSCSFSFFLLRPRRESACNGAQQRLDSPVSTGEPDGVTSDSPPTATAAPLHCFTLKSSICIIPQRLNISQASDGSSEKLNGVTLLHKLLCPMLYWLYFNYYRNQSYGSNLISQKCVLKIREKVFFLKDVWANIGSESVLTCAEVRMELKSTAVYFASVIWAHVIVLLCLLKTILSTTMKSHSSIFTGPLTLVVVRGSQYQRGDGDGVCGCQTPLSSCTSWVSEVLLCHTARTSTGSNVSGHFVLISWFNRVRLSLLFGFFQDCLLLRAEAWCSTLIVNVCFLFQWLKPGYPNTG